MAYQLDFLNLDVSPSLQAKPFLKWAGGKSQLLSQFETLYPPALKNGTINRYVEPFVGGGAVFFELMSQYDIPEIHLNDVNPELIIVYRAIQKNVVNLIDNLNNLSTRYKKLGQPEKKTFFYEIREAYNRQRHNFNYNQFSEMWTQRAAWMIFLNRTCFNGLFRLNSKGGFNVPHGRYKNPRIVDAENLQNVAQLLQNATITCADFESCGAVVDETTFVYFDPPYRPLNETASFTAYSKFAFGDAEQKRLAEFYRTLHQKNAPYLMLSNSDPTNEDPNDTFFDVLYEGFHLHRVLANRMINSKASKRGKIRELVITNYQPQPTN